MTGKGFDQLIPLAVAVALVNLLGIDAADGQSAADQPKDIGTV